MKPHAVVQANFDAAIQPLVDFDIYTRVRARTHTHTKHTHISAIEKFGRFLLM